MADAGHSGGVRASGPQPLEESESRAARRLPALALGALGVVYGDIGTSPLYALKQAVSIARPAPETILGLLSLLFWALVLVVSIKYLLIVMRADNRGEGGILALLALLGPRRAQAGRGLKLLAALGLFGAALLYGDGVITPAISVLSAVEGLETATPSTAPFVVPLTVLTLIVLFLFQRRGTAGIGAVFGPVMLLWFLVLAALGIGGILRAPAVLAAVNPWYGIHFLLAAKWESLAVLGAVFLALTGAEALYADLGHFGRQPIRLGWFGCALPALLLDYFGQGALMLSGVHAGDNPFYLLAPGWAIYPLVALATLATVIASQAIISGAFSLTRQAIQFGQFPRMNIVQTSSEEIGQIYIPTINAYLLIGAIALVLAFRSSGNLAGAYGVAVSTTMAITTILIFFVMRGRWKWNLALAAALAGPFLAIDLAFLCANTVKIIHGGWFPLLVGGALFVIMTTWHRGRELIFERLHTSIEPIGRFMARIKETPPHRVKGAAVFLSAPLPGVPPVLLRHLEHNQVLHEQLVLLTVMTEDQPRVPAAGRLELQALGDGVYQVLVHYGFMQSPSVPVALRLCEELGLEVDLAKTTYYVGRAVMIPTDRVPGMMLWREKLFAFLVRNAASATSFYKLSPEQVVELGIQVVI